MDEAAVATRLETARSAADAILRQSRLPHRRSSAGNRVGRQSGVLAPPASAQAHGLDGTDAAGFAESWWQQTECLLEAASTAAAVHLRLRFLQVLRRQPEALAADGAFRPVGRLDLGGRAEVAFDEAVPREFPVAVPLAELLAGERRVELEAPAGAEMEPLADERGRLAGRLRRRRLSVRAAIVLSASPCAPAARGRHEDGPGPADGPVRLRIRVENASGPLAGTAERDQALALSLLATHVLIAVEHGAFLSLLDPPAWAKPLARRCANVHAFPVLIGEPGQRDLMLSSPILLRDYPQVSPESPGDLRGASEIDETLSLRALT